MPQISYEEVAQEFGQEFAKNLYQQHTREAVTKYLLNDQDFKDAATGLRMLQDWHGDQIANLVAAEIEVRRALYAANLSAVLHGCARSHENREDENGGYTDGQVLRQVMAAAGIVGDWFFVPMMRVASVERFDKYE